MAKAKIVKYEQIIKDPICYITIKNYFDVIKPIYRCSDWCDKAPSEHEQSLIDILIRYKEELKETVFKTVHIKDNQFEFIQKNKNKPIIIIKR